MCGKKCSAPLFSFEQAPGGSKKKLKWALAVQTKSTPNQQNQTNNQQTTTNVCSHGHGHDPAAHHAVGGAIRGDAPLCAERTRSGREFRLRGAAEGGHRKSDVHRVRGARAGC